MQEPETHAFPLADVLSVTTPRLLSARGMDGVCDLVEWMLGIEPIPRMVNLREWRRLRTATDIARTALLRQHPQLRDARPPDGIDVPDLGAWLLDAERAYGGHLVVQRATVEIEGIQRALAGFGTAMTAQLRSVWTALQSAVEAFVRLSDELRELAEAEQDPEDGADGGSAAVGTGS